jgi:hypothetical protein
MITIFGDSSQISAKNAPFSNATISFSLKQQLFESKSPFFIHIFWRSRKKNHNIGPSSRNPENMDSAFANIQSTTNMVANQGDKIGRTFAP